MADLFLYRMISFWWSQEGGCFEAVIKMAEQKIIIYIYRISFTHVLDI